MATRYYMPATGTAAASPAFAGAWGVTSAATRRPTSTTKSNTSLNGGTTYSETSASATNVLAMQYVSGTIGAQTISGTFSCVVLTQEVSASADISLQVVIRVVSNDGSTVRGTLYAGHSATLNTTAGALGQEFGTGALTRIMSAVSLSSVTSQDGDRLAFEVGYRAHNTTATSQSGLFQWGDPTAGTDYALTASLSSNDVPWIELSGTIAPQSGGASATLAGAGSLTSAATPIRPAAVTLAGAGSLIAGRPYFQTADWLWTPIPASPILDPNSAAMVGELDNLVVDGGTHLVNLIDYAVELIDSGVTGGTPRQNISFSQDTANGGTYGTDPFGTDTMPIPAGLQIPPGSDGQVSVLDPTTGYAYSIFQAVNTSGTWSGTWGARSALSGDGRDDTAVSAGAASTGSRIHRHAAVIRASEISAGVINHALFFATNMAASGFRYPAKNSDGVNGSGATNPIPEGTRIQLDPSIDLSAISGITPIELAIGRALQTYGAYCGDQTTGPRIGLVAEYLGNTSGEYQPYVDAGAVSGYQNLNLLPWSSLRVLANWDGLGVTAALTGAGSLSSTASVTKLPGGTLAGAGALTTSATLIKLASTALSGLGAISAAATATTFPTISLSGAGSFSAIASAPIKVGETALAGAGSLTAAPAPVRPAVASLTGDGAFASAAIPFRIAAAALTGDGALSADALPTRAASASLAGAGALSVTATQEFFAQASMAGSGALSADGNPTAESEGALVGVGELSADTEPVVSGAVALVGAGALTPDGLGLVGGASTFAGSSTLSANARATVLVAAALTGDGALDVAGLPVRMAGAALSGAGSLTAAGTRVVFSQASLTGAGALTADPVNVALAAAGLTGDGFFSVESVTAAPLAGIGTLNAASTPVAPGFAPMTAVGRLSVLDTYRADSWLAGTGTLTPNGTRIHLNTLALRGRGEMDVSAVRVVPVSAALAGAGLLTPAAMHKFAGVASLTGAGALALIGVTKPPGATLLSGVGIVVAGAGAITVPVQGRLFGRGALSAAGIRVVSIALIGTGALRDVLPVGGVGLVGGGDFAADIQRAFYATAFLTGTGSLSAASVLHATQWSRIWLGATGSISATSSRVRPGAAILTAHGLLRVGEVHSVVATLIAMGAMSAQAARLNAPQTSTVAFPTGNARFQVARAAGRGAFTVTPR